MADAQIGIFGGSGFYSLLPGFTEVEVDTPFGSPSDRVAVGEIEGRPVAFMARHNRAHTIPPHKINYRANLWAFKSLGITRVIAPCAAGSLKPWIHPGNFVVCDQVIDRTRSRKDTFFDGPQVTHVSTADPYCPELRKLAVTTGASSGLTMHPAGTMVVIEGPRFSTRAESEFPSSQGWDAVSMTQYPEVTLARELEMCFCGIALITDYDSGIEDVAPVSAAEVVRVFGESNEKLRSLLVSLVARIPAERGCSCGSSLTGATLSGLPPEE
ncbi:MAG: S-methyl-5'-thioadenosine phosphorylase [Actinomycetota bacterium]